MSENLVPMRTYKRTTLKRPIAVRFWEKVDMSSGPGGCWPWLGVKSRGYGKLASGARTASRMATHVALELAGIDVPDGMRVCHRCDNPSCVNPAHLFVGTARDNSRDMVAKDRHCRGERYPHHKLTDEQAVQIRELKAAGATYDELEHQFGVGRSPLHRIVTGRCWRHVGGVVQTSKIAMKRLTSAQVEQLRTRFATGTESQTALAAEYGVSVACVCTIVNGLSRARDPGPITKTRTLAPRRAA